MWVGTDSLQNALGTYTARLARKGSPTALLKLTTRADPVPHVA